MSFSTSTACQLTCCRFTERIKGCLLVILSSLKPRAYGRFFVLQDGKFSGVSSQVLTHVSGPDNSEIGAGDGI